MGKLFALTAAVAFALGLTGVAQAQTATTPGKAGTASAGASMRGDHKVMGEVTKIDQSKGKVTLKTEEGEMELHFPPTALSGIKEGDRVEVQLGIRPAAATGTGSTTSGSRPAGKSPAAPAEQNVRPGKQPGQVTNPPGSGAPGSLPK